MSVIVTDCRGLDRESREKLRKGFSINVTSETSNRLVMCCGELMVFDGTRHVCQKCRRTDPVVQESLTELMSKALHYTRLEVLGLRNK